MSPEEDLRDTDLEEVAHRIRTCTRCPLHEARTRAVPGEGSREARIFLLGEGPGEEEDRQGRPFVGRAGRALDQALEAAGVRRKDVFITNAVKCRPPDNRRPRRTELAACAPSHRRQVDLLRPRVLVTLGEVAVRSLLGVRGTVAALRQADLRHGSIPVVATYHPGARRFGRARFDALVKDLMRAKAIVEAT